MSNGGISSSPTLSCDFLNFEKNVSSLNPDAKPFKPNSAVAPGSGPCETQCDDLRNSSDDCVSNSESTENSSLGITETDSPETILKKIRIKNMNRLVIGTLNINSLASKFDN